MQDYPLNPTNLAAANPGDTFNDGTLELVIHSNGVRSAVPVATPAGNTGAVGGLDTISTKLHSVVIPAKGGMSDLSKQGHGLNPILGDVTFDAEGNAVYGPGIRSEVNTDVSSGTFALYALIKWDDAADNDTNMAVFNGSVNTFIPLGSSAANVTETIRVDGVSNAHPFSIDGVTGFANRLEVRNAINTGDFVLIKVEGIASGASINIGDHPQNPGFDFHGALKSLVLVEEPVGGISDSDDLIISHAMQNVIDPLRVSRVATITKTLADIEFPPMDNSGGGTGPALIDHPVTFNFDEPPTLIIEMNAPGLTGNDAAYFTFGTDFGNETGGVGNLGNANARSTAAVPKRSFEIQVPSHDPATGDQLEYHLRVGAGGTSSVPSSSVKITQCLTGSIPVERIVVREPLADGVASATPLVEFEDRQLITTSNPTQTGFGISTWRYHLSLDPSQVGTLQGTDISLPINTPVDLYLVGPSTAGPPSTNNVDNNGTTTAVHFRATWDGTDVTYTVVEAIRVHGGPLSIAGEWANRSYDFVDANQTTDNSPITLASTDFDQLFTGVVAATNLALGPKAIEAGYTLVDGVLESPSTPSAVVHSIVETDNIDDSTVGSKITIVTANAVHLGTQQVTFATNGDITLPQRAKPYVLKWFGGFDFDGDPDREVRVEFSGPTLYSLNATADAFDTSAEGANNDNGDNVTFSAFQWMRPVAFAVIDASAGPVTTSLTFIEGGANVGPTGGTIEITGA